MADVAEFQDEEVRQYLEQLIYRAQNPVQVEEIVGAISAVVFRNIMDHFKMSLDQTANGLHGQNRTRDI